MRTTRNLPPIPSPTPAKALFYRFLPTREEEWEKVPIDPGGGCSAISDIILADAGGFYASTFLDTLSGAVEMLEAASRKVYGGVDCLRIHSYPGFIIVLLPEHRDVILKQWKPLVGESVGERAEILQRVSKLPNVEVPGFPLPEGEA